MIFFVQPELGGLRRRRGFVHAKSSHTFAMLMLVERSIKKLGNVPNLNCHIGQCSWLLVWRTISGAGLWLKLEVDRVAWLESVWMFEPKIKSELSHLATGCWVPRPL